MRAFEFHFNPPHQNLRFGTGQAKVQEDTIFDSFCYEPENNYERKLGSLYLAGELKDALPQNHKFLDRLASFLKKEFYSTIFRSSSESALKDALKKANKFLEEISKKGDVSWLGKLNLAVLNFKNFDFNFTKVGEMKILLLRQGQIIDIGKNLDLSEIEPYPLKIFGNILSGKLAENDLIMVLTKPVYSIFSAAFVSARKKTKKGESKTGGFWSKNILEKISQLTLGAEPVKSINEKTLSEIFRTREKELLKTSGLCLVCHLTKEFWPERQKPKSLIFEKSFEKFSLKRKLIVPTIKFFRSLISKLNSLFLAIKARLRLFKKSAKKEPDKKQKSVHKIPIRIKSPRLNLTQELKKKITPIILLLGLLFFGFLVFQKQAQDNLKEDKNTLNSVQQSILDAQNLIRQKEEEKAFDLLQKSLTDIIPLTQKDSPVKKEATALQESIEKDLAKLSKLENIPEPNLFFEFDQQEFLPQKMVYYSEQDARYIGRRTARYNSNLYLFTSFDQNIAKITSSGQKSFLETSQTFNEAVVFDNSLLFFKKPSSVSIFKNNKFNEPLLLKDPYPGFVSGKIAAYQKNLYIFDSQKGEIIKYSTPLSQGKDQPQIWLEVKNQKALEGASMAIDSSIWILNKDNTISRYYRGALKETLSPKFYPLPKNLSEISVSSAYIYLLEPSQKRIVVLDKTGRIIKQFQSEKFDNLKDFAISGNTIWLLNGSKIYKINL